MSDETNNNVTVDEVLEAYPNARPFADQLQAETMGEFAKLAKEVHERVKAHQEAGDPNAHPDESWREPGEFDFTGFAPPLEHVTVTADIPDGMGVTPQEKWAAWFAAQREAK